MAWYSQNILKLKGARHTRITSESSFCKDVKIILFFWIKSLFPLIKVVTKCPIINQVENKCWSDHTGCGLRQLILTTQIVEVGSLWSEIIILYYCRSLKTGRHYLNYSMLVLIKCCFVICWVSVKEIKRVGNFSNYTIYNKGHYINFYFFLHSLKSVLTLHSLKTVFPFWWRLMKLHTAFLLLHVRIIKYLCVKTEYMVAMDDLPDVRDHRWSQHFLKTEE